MFNSNLKGFDNHSSNLFLNSKFKTQKIAVLITPAAQIHLALTLAHATKAMREMDSLVSILTSVLSICTTVMPMQTALIMKEALLAHAKTVSGQD